MFFSFKNYVELIFIRSPVKPILSNTMQIASTEGTVLLWEYSEWRHRFKAKSLLRQTVCLSGVNENFSGITLIKLNDDVKVIQGAMRANGKCGWKVLRYSIRTVKIVWLASRSSLLYLCGRSYHIYPVCKRLFGSKNKCQLIRRNTSDSYSGIPTHAVQ